MTISLVEPVIGEEEIKAVTEVLRSTWLCQGRKVVEFEKNLAERLDVKHVICVTSCTAALHLSLLWLRFQRKRQPRYEVIVPDFTFPATANAVRHAGLVPVFVDVNSMYTMDAERLKEERKNHTLAILPVHLFGQPANMGSIMDIANDEGISVIEDCAGALFAEYKDKYVGKFGLTGCFSFTPRKLITTGEGGAITTENDELAEWLRLMRSHGRKIVESIHDMTFPVVGLNYRMTEIQAALGIEQLKRAEGFITKRNMLAEIYRVNLPRNIFCAKKMSYTTQHTYTTYTVYLDDYCPSKRHMIDGLRKRGIQAHYSSIALHLEPSLKQYVRHKSFPIASAFSERTIALPLHPGMTKEDVIYVCNSLQELLE